MVSLALWNLIDRRKKGGAKFRNGTRGMKPPPPAPINRKSTLGKRLRRPAQWPQIASRYVATGIRRQSILTTFRRAKNTCECFCQPGSMSPDMCCKSTSVSHQDPGRYHSPLPPQMLCDPLCRLTRHSLDPYSESPIARTRHQIIFVNSGVNIDHPERSGTLR
jgi:hypothetical protein